MANPTDSSGNVAIDFQWGNMPLQPDDARVSSPSTTTVVGGDQNVGWTYVSTTPSAKLAENYSTVTLNGLPYTVAPDNHVIAYENWDSYPSTDGLVGVIPSAMPWSPIVPATPSANRTDGTSTITVPNVVGTGYQYAKETLTLAGLDVTVAYTTTSATAANHDTVQAQSIAAGASSIHQGDAITITLYKYHDATTPGTSAPYNG